MGTLWSKPSNTFNPLVTFIENSPSVHVLPVDYTCNLSIISGALPPGIQLIQNQLVGTADAVVDRTDYIVVFRAEQNDSIEDRTFLIQVIDKTQPQWITPAGRLVLNGNIAPIPDSFVLDFKLVAVDDDEAAGEHLRYYLSGGQLPPGIFLTTDGHLRGICGAVMIMLDGDMTDQLVHTYPYIHPSVFTSGHDSNYYDISNRDQEILELYSRYRLSRLYQFQVSVYDGRTEPVSRDFEIAVIGDELYRVTDVTLITDYNFPIMESAPPRLPAWLTSSDLGSVRTNSNITLFLDIIDPNNMTGYALYTLLDTNPDSSESKLPPGLTLDHERGIIYGTTPTLYSNRAVYKFTIRALSVSDVMSNTLYSDKTFELVVIDDLYSVITWKTPSDLGTLQPYENCVYTLVAESSNRDLQIAYKLVSGKLPDGLSLAGNGNIIGVITFLQDESVRDYSFVVNAYDRKNNQGINREFTVHVGEFTNIKYTDIWLYPYFTQMQRQSYYNMIGDTNVFDPAHLYRTNDSNFGLRPDPEILLYSGIQTDALVEYASTFITFPRTQLRIVGLNLATAYEPGTRNPVYEVLYIELHDPNSPQNANGTQLETVLSLRTKLSQLGETDYRHERLWLRTVQPSVNTTQVGYVIAAPLAYCLPDHGKYVLRSLLMSDHDFYQYDFDLDRMAIHDLVELSKRYVYFEK